MAKFMQSRRKMLIAAGEAAAVGALGYFGLKHLLSSDKQGRSGPNLKVVFVVAPDGMGTDGVPPWMGGGYAGGLWNPKVDREDSQDFTLPEASGELAPYKSQSLYLTGLILGIGNVGHYGGHMLLRETAQDRSLCRHSSIDTILGEAMPAPTRVLYSTPHNDNHEYGWYSWTGTAPRSIEANPRVIFQRVFGGPNSRNDNVGGAHVLDLAYDDITELRGRLGAGSQRQKLDTQLDAVEQLANDLEDDTGPVPGCSPEDPGDLPFMTSARRNEVTLAHFKVVTSALSCGLTRVATITLGRSSDQVTLPETPGLPDISQTNPHDLAHLYNSVPEWVNSRRWYTRQVRILMDTLNSLPDPQVPGDSLLKHTLVVFTNECSDGRPEHTYNMPMVLMGGASGLLRSGSGGRVLDLTSQGEQQHHAMGRCANMQRLWATIAQLAGTSVPYGGNVEPLTGIFNS